MAATDVTRAGDARGNINSASHDTPSFGDRARRLMTETKAATKTTEFFMVVAAVVGILVSAMLIKGGDTGGTDEFIARQAWLYVAIIVGAYADRAWPGEVGQSGAVHRRRQQRQPLLVRACSAGGAPVGLSRDACPSSYWRRVGIAENDGRSALPRGGPLIVPSNRPETQHQRIGVTFVSSKQTQKIVQYLNEAHGAELALVRQLQAQIAMTPKGSTATGWRPIFRRPARTPSVSRADCVSWGRATTRFRSGWGPWRPSSGRRWR